MLPRYLEAARLLEQKYANLRLLLTLAPGIDRSVLEQWSGQTLPNNLVTTPPEALYNAMQCCSVAMVTMGTVVLEGAMMRLPMVAANRISPLSYLILRPLVKIPHLTLPNIIAGRTVVPELLQSETAPANLAQQVANLIENPTIRTAQQRGFDRIIELIGDDDAAPGVAKLILKMLEKTG